MAVTLLRQNDPRWAAYPFCPGGTLATHGCGPTSMAMALGMSTPIPEADFLTNNGYASSQYGTDHDGVIAGIKASGYNCWYSGMSLNGVMVSRYFDTLIDHVNGGKVAILIMGGPQSAGGPCRTDYWCQAGHFVTACGFANNQIKINDPAWYVRDGYHSVYGTTADALNGNIKYIYLTEIKWLDGPSTDYKFTLPQIQKGSSGNVVKFWQRILFACGFYGGEIDGQFGTNTEKGTKGLQKILNLKVDGKVGPKTWNAVIPVSNIVNNANITFTLPQIEYGYKGGAAYFLQEILKGWKYVSFNSDYTFGNGCRAGLLNFQRDHGLQMDAVSGKNTWKALIGV